MRFPRPSPSRTALPTLTALALVLVVGGTSTAAAAASTLYVSPTGSDAAPGTAARPLATMTKALSTAGGGERIVLAAGSYPAAKDGRARSAWVTVVGPAKGTASVAGLTISGGQRLDVSGIRFTAGVSARSVWTRATGTVAPEHLHFTDSEFTNPGGTCVGARDGASDVVIANNHIHDCLVGFGAGAGGPIVQSSGLTITGNRIEDLTGDGIQFGQWNDVEISDNDIDDLRDPAGKYHNDAIQLTGNSARVRIDGNTLTDSRTQLLFIQDAMGPIDDVDVTNNVIAGAGAVAVQSLGATRVRFLHNTIWGGKDGGLWLGRGSASAGHAATSATDTVVVNNVMSSFAQREGSATSKAAGNVAPCVGPKKPDVSTDGAGTTCVSDVGFRNATAGDLRLVAGAKARALGSRLATLRIDRDGLARSGVPVPGAYR